jgi:hypothetical protein
VAGGGAGKAAGDGVDRDLALAALHKRQAGVTPSRREAAALARVEAQQEEARRWAYYRSIPQKHWREMSGRQTKVLHDQAELYGIPFGGATIDLPAVARRLHDFLAEHAQVFAALRTPAGSAGGGDDDAALAVRLLRAKTAEKEADARRKRVAADRAEAAVVARPDHEAALEALVRACAAALRGLAAECGALAPQHEQDFGARAERRLGELADMVAGRKARG